MDGKKGNKKFYMVELWFTTMISGDQVDHQYTTAWLKYGETEGFIRTRLQSSKQL